MTMTTSTTMKDGTAADPSPPPPPTLEQPDTTASLKQHRKESAAMDSLPVNQSTMKSPASTTNNAEKKKDDDMNKESSSSSSTTDNDDSTSTTSNSTTAAIFGDFTATTLADALSNRLEQAFQSSVAQLPMLRQPQVLLQRLRDSYLRHVDILEVYCHRNLFTLDNKNMFPLSQRMRQRIVQLHQEIKHSSDVEFPVLENDDNDIGNKVVVQPLVLANNNNDGPSPVPRDEEIKALQDEMTTLRQRLDQAQKTRLLLMRSLNEIEQAEQLAGMAMGAVATLELEQDDGKLHDSMTAVAVGAQGLLLYDQQGREHLLENINNRHDNNSNNNKRNRSEMSNDENDENCKGVAGGGGDLMSDNAWNCMLVVDKKNKKPLSALEQYKQEKAQMGIMTSNGDFAKVQQLILGQRHKTIE